jgi:tetratricopeptide (TPR) repeat protein
MSRPSVVVTPNRDGRGFEPQRQIFLFENHDEALSLWRRAGVSSRILVHIDPHHDMWWNRPGAGVNFANYVCAALQEDLVRQVYWVVPSASWAAVRNRRQILHQLRGILEAYPGKRRNLRFERRRARAEVLGKPLEVCALDALPELSEPVLLDLDVDFLVLPRVAANPSAEHAKLPCCWPEELVAQIRARNLPWDLATIAYSVEGGYTPLRWKYLGQELALRLGPDAVDSAQLRAVAHLRNGAEAASRGDLEASASEFRTAASEWPESAAPLLQLALLSQRRGERKEARTLYRLALERDPSYRTVYSGDGLWHYWNKNYLAARVEFQRLLALDPGDATSLVGLAWLAMRKKRWQEVEGLSRKALERDPARLDAWRALGKALERQGQYAEAGMALERSLQLALAGYHSYQQPAMVYTGAVRLVDAGHWQTFVDLGRLHRKQGNRVAARRLSRMALAGGYESLELHRQLLRLGSDAGGWPERAKQLCRCAMQVLRTGSKLLSPVWSRIQRLYETWLAW